MNIKHILGEMFITTESKNVLVIKGEAHKKFIISSTVLLKAKRKACVFISV